MNYQKIKIGEAGNLTTGLVVKRKQAELSEHVIRNYNMLTLKSFDQDGWLNTKDLEIFRSTEELDDKYLTREGDVIVRLSYPYTSIAIDKKHEGFLISSLFVVVRLEIDCLLPDYLSIYLNSENMKRFYTKSAVGSAIQIIKTSMLRDIIVSFPTLEKQKKVVELNRLILRENALLVKLIHEKTRYNKEIINNLITGGVNNGK